jgi:hypothetical protein
VAAKPDSGEFAAAWSAWWAKFPPPKKLTAGVVRRINVLEMIGENQSFSRQSAKSLVTSIGDAVDEILAGKATRWTPATGYIDIHYGPLGPHAADLKHSIILTNVERIARDATRIVKDRRGGEASNTQRRLAWEKFEELCARNKVRTDQIQILDVGEAVLGKPEPNQKLSLRVWSAVDGILDEALEGVGYSTRYSGNRVLLFFPGYSKQLGDIKRKAIASDIASAVGASIKRDGDGEADLSGSGDALATEATSVAKAEADSTPPLDKKEQKELDLLSQAMAALAADRLADQPDPAELMLPDECDIRPVPMWLAKKRTIGGYVLEPLRKVGRDWDRDFPASDAEMDSIDLAILARASDRIEERIAAGKSSLIVVPVYWPYLDRTKQRNRYLWFCSKIPEAARRLLVLELAGIPEELMQSRVEERLMQLRPFFRSVVCRVRLGRRDFSQFKNVPIHSVGIDLGELPDYERGIIPALDAFMDAVTPLKVRTYAYGLSTRSLLVAAQAAGFDYVAGRVIPDSPDAPLGICDFKLSDLYDVSVAGNPPQETPSSQA